MNTGQQLEMCMIFPQVYIENLAFVFFGGDMLILHFHIKKKAKPVERCTPKTQ